MNYPDYASLPVWGKVKYNSALSLVYEHFAVQFWLDQNITKDKKFSIYHTAAICGNTRQESVYNPVIQGDPHIPGFSNGIQQWNNKRNQAMMAFCVNMFAIKGFICNDYPTAYVKLTDQQKFWGQLHFCLTEITGPSYKKALKCLLENETDPGLAGKFGHAYEGFGDTSDAKRNANATAVIASYKAGLYSNPVEQVTPQVVKKVSESSKRRLQQSQVLDDNKVGASALPAIVKVAGKYPVTQIPCPFFKNEFVDLKAPRMGILHTTEGGWDGSMNVFHSHFAPHFLLGVNAKLKAHHRMMEMRHKVGEEHLNKMGAAPPPPPPEPTGKVEIAQLVPIGNIGAAIVTHNNQAIVQVEMIGYAREEAWLPSDETVEALASLMLVCRDTYGIPLFRPWPDSVYGRAGKTDHRNDGHFGKVAGWFGHGDCPTPDTHWDPGFLSWSKIFALAKSIGNQTKVSAKRKR